MPELPEVETVVRDLKPKLLGQTFMDFEIFVPRIAHVPKNILKDNKIVNIFRRAKYIILELKNGFLVLHLRMTGRILVGKLNEDKHISFLANLKSGDKFYFKDVRKFGTIEWHKDLKFLDCKLGVEPLDNNFNLEHLSKLAVKKQIIKSFLLDQKNVVGIGNIYADEILWQAKINPLRRVCDLSDSEIRILYRSIKEILTKAIKFNGTTFINFQYGEQKIGEYAKYLNVFTKVEKPCKRCKTKIEKIKVAQRGTYFCSQCQK